jgi:ribonuclease P protein component
MRFRPEQHLRRPGDFRAVREQGRRLDCGAFTAWFLPAANDATPAADRRLGVVASTAAVGNAVARNRAKRRLRALFRLHQDKVAAGSDLLLVARRAATRVKFAELEQKFLRACEAANPKDHA